MINGADRRQAARLTVPRRWGGGELEHHLVRLLDLSPQETQITHREPLHAGKIGYVDLPPTLEAVRLTGRLVWTRLRRIKQTPAGGRRALYESGLEFTSLTPAQQTALTTALATLQAGQATSDREPSA